MSNVDYSLLYLNRRVRIRLNNGTKQLISSELLFRDFKKLVGEYGCMLSSDNKFIVGTEKVFEIKVDFLN